MRNGNGKAKQDTWFKQGNIWYYFDDIVMVTDSTYIEGELHLFTKSGAWIGKSNVTNGWVETAYGWIYLQNAEITYGWKKLNNVWYYFQDYDGTCYTDGNCWVSGDNAYYIFDANGALVTNGWYQDSYGDWCYANAQGIAVENEWIKSGNAWYYLEGAWMVEGGIHWIDDEMHVFADNGAWIKQLSGNEEGWQFFGGKWYYFEDGYPAEGFKKIDGKVYGFDRSGYYMVTNDVLSIWSYDYDYVGEPIGIYSKYLGFDANGNIAKNQWIYSKSYEEWIWCDENGYALPINRNYGVM